MIPSSFERLKSTRAKTIVLVTGLSQGDFDRRPLGSHWNLGEAGSWSIGEIVDHILRVMKSVTDEIEELIRLKEAGQNPEVRRSFRDYDVSPAIMPKRLMSRFEPIFALTNAVSAVVLPASIRETLIRTRILPIRNPTKWLPEKRRPAPELMDELRASIARLSGILERYSSINFDKLVFWHTVFGRYNVAELLSVLAISEEWHHPDIEVLLGRRPVA
jgi:hypothetical protein